MAGHLSEGPGTPVTGGHMAALFAGTLKLL